MQYTKKIIYVLIMICLCVTTVNAKNTILTCEYYKPYDELTGSQQAGILCNVYTDYSHQCYVEYGAASATTKSNKEKIQNWGSAIGLTWKAKDYVKEKNKCPDYILAKLEKGIDGYELHAAETLQEALNIQAKLNGQRYIATNKNGQTAEEIEKAKQEVQKYIDEINDFIKNYSLEKCMDNDKVITRTKECEDSISAFKGRLSNYETNVYNYINSNKLKETDDVVKNYRKAKEDADTFLGRADAELKEEDQKIKEELGLETTETPNEENTNENQEGIYEKPNTELPKMCEQESILKSFRFFGYLLFVVKIIVPILLIVMGTLDFGKAVVASNQDAVSKAAKMFAIRIVAGISIFLLPTIVNFVFDLLPSSVSDYSTCKTCLFDPTNCNIAD